MQKVSKCGLILLDQSFIYSTLSFIYVKAPQYVKLQHKSKAIY